MIMHTSFIVSRTTTTTPPRLTFLTWERGLSHHTSLREGPSLGVGRWIHSEGDPSQDQSVQKTATNIILVQGGTFQEGRGGERWRQASSRRSSRCSSWTGFCSVWRSRSSKPGSMTRRGKIFSEEWVNTGQRFVEQNFETPCVSLRSLRRFPSEGELGSQRRTQYVMLLELFKTCSKQSSRFKN